MLSLHVATVELCHVARVRYTDAQSAPIGNSLTSAIQLGSFKCECVVTALTMRSANLLLAFATQWQDLEHLMPSPGGDLVIDSALDPSKPNYSDEKPTLYRERHGWCPYSERSWLALEYLNVPYDTIRIDNTGELVFFFLTSCTVFFYSLLA